MKTSCSFCLIESLKIKKRLDVEHLQPPYPFSYIVCYLIKPLKLCKRKSGLLFRILLPVFVVVNMTQYVENFNHHDSTGPHLSVQSQNSVSLFEVIFQSRLNFSINFPFVSLEEKKEKELATEMLIQSSKYLLLNFYVVSNLQPEPVVH